MKYKLEEIRAGMEVKEDIGKENQIKLGMDDGNEKHSDSLLIDEQTVDESQPLLTSDRIINEIEIEKTNCCNRMCFGCSLF